MSFFDTQTKGALVKYGVIAVAGLGVFYFLFRKTEKVALAAADAVKYTATVGINPLEERNWANQAVTSLGDVLDDGAKDNSFSLGSKIADWFPSDAEKKYLESLKK